MFLIPLYSSFFKVLDQDDSEYDIQRSPLMASSRRGSDYAPGEQASPAITPQRGGLKTRVPGRASRRVSLIPGEALEQARAAFEREQLSRRGSSQLGSPCTSRRPSAFSASFEEVLRSSLHQTQQQQRRIPPSEESCDYELYDPHSPEKRDRRESHDVGPDGEPIASPNR